MSVRRFSLITVGLAVAAIAAGILIGVLTGRSGTTELALTASWGGFVLLLVAALLWAGDASTALYGMRPDRANAARWAPGHQFLQQVDIDAVTRENQSRFERVAGPGLVLACGGLVAIALSLAVHRLA